MNFLPFKPLRWLIILLFALRIAEAADSSENVDSPEHSEIYSQDEVRELTVNVSITREMGKNELHVYSFRGEAGKCLHLAVEQQGTDVIATLVSPTRQTLTFAERSNTLQGPENLTFVLPENGVYLINLKSTDWVELKNGYTIELKPFTVPNDLDLKRIEAERTVSEAGSLSFDSQKRKESIEKFNQAIILWENLGDEYEKTVAFYGLGWTYIYENEFENAAVAFGKAAENARQINEVFMLAHSLRGAATANSNLGEYVGAVISAEESISIFRSLKMLRYTGSGLQALGYAQYFLEDYSNAISSFSEALECRQKVKDQNGEILTLIALAKTHSRLKNNALALEFIGKAKQQAANGNVSQQTEIFTEEGWILLDLKRLEEAETSFNAALKNYQAANSITGQAIVYCGLGLVKQNKKQWKEALFDVEKSLEIIENLRGKLTDNRFRLSFSATNQAYYEIYINLLMQVHQIYPNQGFDAKAFETSEKARARVLLDLVGESGFLDRKGLPIELKNKIHDLQTRYIANLKEWRRLKRTTNNAAELKTLSLKLQKTILEKRELDTATKSNFTERAEFQVFRPSSAKDIQALLDDETILLEYGLYRNNYGNENSYLWAVTKNTISGFVLPPRTEIEAKVNRAYQLLTVRNNFPPKLSEREKQFTINQAENEYRQISADLSKMLLAPLVKANLLKSKKKLLIVSNGILQSLPFASLPNPAGKNASDFLISNFEIANLPSASILGALRERRKNRVQPEKTALVLADPVFSQKDERFAADSKPKSVSAVNSQSVLRLADYFAQSDLPRLFNTRFEAEKISSYLPNLQKRIELDFNATVESVTKTDLSNYRILHFATHALVDDETPELSGIVLSLFDNQRQPIEGFLLSGDIFDLKLNADLVVLSGCRTGLGKPVRGEGFVGLTQSFMYAGTSRLLTSLWSVEDRATAQLMAYFYKNHLEKKMSVSAALKEAQLEMSKHPRWRNPYFWAAFTLQGEFR